ncbi:MAG: hypothetical protein AAFW00_17855 [Bacteroidota bacterium]
MPFEGKYILAAIDGTDSREWGASLPNRHNSHTYSFYRDLRVSPGGSKAYWDGPDGASGSRTEAIADNATDFVRREMRHLFPRTTPNETQLRIVLVGHSRGGLIAINVARRLPFPVYFLALYDAVDRHIGLDGSYIINVQHTFHALRDPDVGSRSYFSNTGRASAGNYKEKAFFTSHGGIGGAPDFEPDDSFFSSADTSCDNQTLTGGVYAMQGANLEQECLRGSQAAHRWMVQKARNKGLPL